MYIDTNREERLRQQASEHEQPVLTPERLLHGRVRDLLATGSLFRAGELATLLGLEAFLKRSRVNSHPENNSSSDSVMRCLRHQRPCSCRNRFSS